MDSEGSLEPCIPPEEAMDIVIVTPYYRKKAGVGKKSHNVPLRRSKAEFFSANFDKSEIP